MTIFIILTCDFPDCDRQKRAYTLTKSQLVAHARQDGWQIGVGKHFCPDHRYSKRRIPFPKDPTPKAPPNDAVKPFYEDF